MTPERSPREDALTGHMIEDERCQLPSCLTKQTPVQRSIHGVLWLHEGAQGDIDSTIIREGSESA